MLKRLVAVVVLVAVPAVFIAANPAGADHDNVFAPCDPADTRPLGEQVYYIDYQSNTAKRFDDPFWGQQTDNWQTEYQRAWVWTP